MPDKLRDLQQTITMEAAKYNVFPLDDSRVSRFMGEKPNHTPGRTVFTYSGELSNVPFPGSGGAEGMLVTDGGRFGGYGFYVLKGKPVFTWNLIQLEIVKWQGNDALASGKHTVEFDWKYDGPGLGKGGTGTLEVDGKTVDSHPMA